LFCVSGILQRFDFLEKLSRNPGTCATSAERHFFRRAPFPPRPSVRVPQFRMNPFLREAGTSSALLDDDGLLPGTFLFIGTSEPTALSSLPLNASRRKLFLLRRLLPRSFLFPTSRSPLLYAAIGCSTDLCSPFRFPPFPKLVEATLLPASLPLLDLRPNSESVFQLRSGKLFFLALISHFSGQCSSQSRFFFYSDGAPLLLMAGVRAVRHRGPGSTCRRGGMFFFNFFTFSHVLFFVASSACSAKVSPPRDRSSALVRLRL